MKQKLLTLLDAALDKVDAHWKGIAIGSIAFAVGFLASGALDYSSYTRLVEQRNEALDNELVSTIQMQVSDKNFERCVTVLSESVAQLETCEHQLMTCAGVRQ